ITHLVRIAAQTIFVQSIWEGLATHAWSDAQLAELQTALAPLDFLTEFHESMRGERAGSIAYVELMRRKRDFQILLALGNAFGNENSKVKTANSPLDEAEEFLSATSFYAMPDGWFYETELAYAVMHQKWNFPKVDVSGRLVSPARSKQLDDEARFALKPNSVKNILARLLFESLGRATSKSARAQSYLDLLRTALALERHRLAHGEYPATLDALAPQFLAQVPHDLINGQPLHYRREASGQFILYSVGWNETDDGGAVVLKEKSRTVDTDQGDWVWRYPATTK
ncbi:MAG: hypothetical protein RL380_743, partial [Verrucomicrobiota bacterium]